MKYLCICQYGHSRSVAMCRVLHARDHEAVPIGWMTSPSVLGLMAAWADRIYTATPDMLNMVPREHREKARSLDIGPDVWSNPYHPELIETVKVAIARVEG